MIGYACDSSEPDIRAMWKTCFRDNDAFMDIYFRQMYRPENTLVYFDAGRAVASLQMLHFKFTFYRQEIPIVYLSGLCTLPEARKKGYMGKLIRKSFDEMVKTEIPLAVLIPQNSRVTRYYEKFGFAQAFVGGEPLDPLKDILDEYRGDLRRAYEAFDGRFRNQDMTVQKTFADFRAIAEEAALYRFPSKKSLSGMVRIIDAGQLLGLYAKANPGASFNLNLKDDIVAGNSRSFSVGNGETGRFGVAAPMSLDTDVAQLAQLLLGYRTTERPADIQRLFPEKKPRMHFMLE